MRRILFAVFLLLNVLSCNHMQKETVSVPNAQWWKEAVVYQIYPRSFQDSDGDGVGDLKGIISRLDYVKSLGIDVVWLNPIFNSPNFDNGYDISDYQSVLAEFGTMEDFDALLKGMHDRGIKLVMDLVVNHSSDQHNWFKQSRSSRDNPYRDYYHWWPAEKGKPQHRWSFFDINSDAWAFDSVTNSYYLHYFAKQQPDLNWENPKLRKEVYDMMHFWFKKGVDGFRMDVIPFISKDTSFPALPAEYNGDYVKYYAKGPRLHEYLHEMNTEVLSKYNVMTVGEGAGVQIEDALSFVDDSRKELNMFYHFDGVSLGYLPGEFKQPDPKGYDLLEFKKIYSKWDSVFAKKGWGTIYLGNHDQPRMLTRWGNDAPEFREASSKLLHTFLLSMRATPYLYYGDELGMNNIKFDKIEDYKDIETLNKYAETKAKGGDLQRFLNGQKISARDNGRTPMQWDAGLNAGFTKGNPWLKVNPNHTTVNVEAQEKDPQSILSYYKKMITLRKENKTLVYGQYQLVDKDNPKVYAYTRTLDKRQLLVVMNFSKDKAVCQLPKGMSIGGKVLINNYTNLNIAAGSVSLQPYQAIIMEVSE